MKKLVLTIISAVAVSSAAFAQGTLNWAAPTVNIIGQTNDTQYSAFFGGGPTVGSDIGSVGATPTYQNGGFYYTLLYSAYTGSQAAQPTTVSNLLDWSWAGSAFYMTNGSVANGRISPIVPNTQAAAPWAALTTSNVMLIGWSVNLGTTWSSVSNYLANWSTLGSTVVGQAFFGESETGFITAGSGNPGTAIFGTGTGNISNPSGSPMEMYLLPVPEPATIALAGLGGLSLLLFRRRKV